MRQIAAFRIYLFWLSASMFSGWDRPLAQAFRCLSSSPLLLARFSSIHRYRRWHHHRPRQAVGERRIKNVKNHFHRPLWSSVCINGEKTEDAEKEDVAWRFSLAGPYLVAISYQEFKDNDHEAKTTTTCRLYPLSCLESRVEDAYRHSEGAMAWWCLHHDEESLSMGSMAKEITIQYTFHSAASETKKRTYLTSKRDTGNKARHELQVDLTGSSDVLTCILSRILVQWAMANINKRKTHNCSHDEEQKEQWKITWPYDEDLVTKIKTKFNNNVNNHQNANLVQTLFQGIHIVVPGKTELVEMVDRHGTPLGQVPRKLVHQYNLLHRGIGMFVTQDKPIQLLHDGGGGQKEHGKQQRQQPALYVHQRTASKRIFPSLYDMFVGGVSTAGESSRTTAEREVAEELGLQNDKGSLSDCLWTCVVCTAYNRCVVDFFSYTMDTTAEMIKWQEEEVAWGSFVPYAVVEASADLSIQRLVKRKQWPSRYPPIQAAKHQKGGRLNKDAITAIVAKYNEEEANMGTATDIKKLMEWDKWNYVPDGLLVWEAWLNWLEQNQRGDNTITTPAEQLSSC